jgi:mannose-6-phosphate isomerase
MKFKKNIFRLQGVVQHYAWGGTDFIPALLNVANSGNKPFAEYWIGAHDNAPSMLNDSVALNQFIKETPSVLGDKVYRQFGRLPFLLKILDVKEMLSIQVHPSKQAAEKEFAREQQLNIPLTAANRNYKDDNHKPELMMALSDFWLLHGFKEPRAMLQTLDEIEAFESLVPLLKENGYQGFYHWVMTMSQESINYRLRPLLNEIVPQYQRGVLEKTNPHLWAARAAITYNQGEDIDRGIFSIYLLNLVHLKKGEAIFQDAGILHAYLEGQNVEIMANSDNVLRGGLTPKHVDVRELMKHVIFESVTPNIITGTAISKVEKAFITPAPDFELSVIQLGAGEQYAVTARTTDIFFVLNGQVMANSAGEDAINLHKGNAMAAIGGAEVLFESKTGGELCRASVSL